jgi:hypothetical protein
MMTVTGGATDVTTYFVLRLAADGTEATGLTITNFDLQYVRSGVAPAAKVDATALAATDSAHGDNQAIEIDGTDQPGLYRVDWPDAAFAAGVKEVILTVKCATAFTEHLRVMINAPVVLGNTAHGGGAATLQLDTLTVNGATTLEEVAVTTNVVVSGTVTADITGNLSGSVGSVTGAVGSVAAGGITAASIATGAIDADALAADAGTEIATAVWAAVTRTLTALDEDTTTLDLDATIAAAVPTAAQIATAVLTTAMTETYRSAGGTATLAQAVYELIAHMGDSVISGTTKTLRKIDGTTAKTFTLDSASTPTSITEAT